MFDCSRLFCGGWCGNVCREISILLDAESDGDVHLVVYYVVLHASWSPKYDVRTFVNDRTMQVSVETALPLCPLRVHVTPT